MENNISSEIGYEAADPPNFEMFHSLHQDGKLRISDWNPNFKEDAEEIIYLVLYGTPGQARKVAESLLEKTARLWDK